MREPFKDEKLTIILLAYICLAPLVVILYLLFWLGVSPSAVDVITEFLILMSRKISSKFSKYAYYTQSAGFTFKRGGGFREGENGKILIKKTNDTINRWKAGKFLPFTDRPNSANFYALPKVW